MDAARTAAGLDWAAASPRRRGIVWARWAPLLGFLATAALAGALAGPDAGWDLRNYHLYNGVALLRGRVGIDLAPAQLQTFYAPDLDLLYALLLRALNAHPALLDAVLALPHGVAAFLAWHVARRMLPADTPGGARAGGGAAAIGITGAGGLPTLATRDERDAAGKLRAGRAAAAGAAGRRRAARRSAPGCWPGWRWG